MSTREMSDGERLDAVREAILVALHRCGRFSKRQTADWEEVMEAVMKEVKAPSEVFKEMRLTLLSEHLVLGGWGGLYLSPEGRQVASRLASAVGDDVQPLSKGRIGFRQPGEKGGPGEEVG